MILLLALLALAVPASAGTVKRATAPYCDHYAATFNAAPGERNDLTVAPVSPGVYRFHDAGALLHGCLRVDDHTALCGAPPQDVFAITANLGDGDDVAHSIRADVDGGTGNDTLTGEHGTLTGGPGSDVLTTTVDHTYFVDDDGTHPAPDRYLGAPGKASLIAYNGRTEDLRIDLRTPFTTAEGDYLENIEDVVGGDGDDVIIGNDSPNTLYGGRGSDRLVGLGGNDKLYSGLAIGTMYPPELAWPRHSRWRGGRRPAERQFAPPRRERVPLRPGPRLHR